MDISVLICTHNPDLERLQRVFTALDQQTMSKDRWECIVIDNCSEPPLSGRVDITWHPKARCVREERLGLLMHAYVALMSPGGNILFLWMMIVFWLPPI